MPVRIVTDSTADIPPEVARELGIEIVPVYVYFGLEEYRDGVDLSGAEFYKMLKESPVQPKTSQPPPEDFAKKYREICQDAEGIITIVISSKLSGVYSSALRGAEMAGCKCPIEVIDSKFNSVGLGLIAIAAAKTANLGASVKEVAEEASKAIKNTKMLGVFDTLKYILRGGRVSKIRGLAAGILGVKPMFTFREGEVVQSGLARSYNKGIEKLIEFTGRNTKIFELAIAHSACLDRAEQLKKRLGTYMESSKILISELGPALGVHGGEGVLLIALRVDT